MGRYRPPQPKASPYITAEGYTRLDEELKALWKRRAIVVKILAAAAAEGDRSENAEYIYRKKELREIDYRIRYLQKRLPELKVVNTLPDNPEQVFFGAWVTVEDDEGNEKVWRIVGPDEFDAKKGWISMDSPVAKALLKKHLHDDVIVTTPSGRENFYICDVRYEETNPPGQS